MNFDRLLAKIQGISARRLSLNEDECGCDVTSPEYQTQSILRLRNKVHDLDLKIMDLEDELTDNKRLQQENEAVKKAWEQYQIVLKLAKE